MSGAIIQADDFVILNPEFFYAAPRQESTGKRKMYLFLRLSCLAKDSVCELTFLFRTRCNRKVQSHEASKGLTTELGTWSAPVSDAREQSNMLMP